MNSQSKRHKLKKPKRHSLERLLIVVEGSKNKSEQAYLQKLIQCLRSSAYTVNVKVHPGGGEPSKVLHTCLALLEDASKNETPYDKACLVIDKDEHATLKDTIDKCKKQTLIPIYVVVTNPQFELWLLWHAQEQAGSITKTDLEKKVLTHKLVSPNNPKCLNLSFDIASYKQAIANAYKANGVNQTYECKENPSSGMPWLIEKLLLQKP